MRPVLYLLTQTRQANCIALGGASASYFRMLSSLQLQMRIVQFVQHQLPVLLGVSVGCYAGTVIVIQIPENMGLLPIITIGFCLSVVYYSMVPNCLRVLRYSLPEGLDMGVEKAISSHNCADIPTPPPDTYLTLPSRWINLP